MEEINKEDAPERTSNKTMFSIPQGERNDTMTRYAGKIKYAFPQTYKTMAGVMLVTANALYCKPPLPQREIDKIIDSVGRYSNKELYEITLGKDSKILGEKIDIAHRNQPLPFVLDNQPSTVKELWYDVNNYTEADPNGVVMALYTMIGTLLAGSTEFNGMTTNLFTVLVGPSNKGKKGTATDDALNIMTDIYPDFKADHVVGDVGSGEGVINLVRDEEEDEIPSAFIKPIKRKLLILREFGLKMGIQKGRQGVTIDHTLNNAFDGQNLQANVVDRTASKKLNNLKATAGRYALGVLGNITQKELLHLTDDLSAVNGVQNRLLQCYVYGSKRIEMPGLSRTGYRNEKAYRRHIQEIAEAIKCVLDGKHRHIRLATDNYVDKHKQGLLDLYLMINKELDDMDDTFLGNMLQRMRTYWMKLTLLIAVLDPYSHVICKEGKEAEWDPNAMITETHMQQAYQIIEYIIKSTRVIYNDRVYTDGAQKIYTAVLESDKGYLTFGKLSDLFSRHKSEEFIKQCIDELDNAKKVDVRTLKRIDGQRGPTIHVVALRGIVHDDFEGV